MSRLEVICSKLLGKFLLGFHFHDLPKDILFFLILILVFTEIGLEGGNLSRSAGDGEGSIFFLELSKHMFNLFLAVSPEIFLINATFILLIHGVRHELVLGVEKQAKEPTLDRRFQLPIFALESNPEMGSAEG
ncbi:hypothetical protein ACJX0J_004408 (mitochondrion) [Zea mays]